MKKYPVTKFYIGIFGVDLFIFVVTEAILIWGVDKSEPVNFYLISFHIVGAIGIICTLYCIFFDLPTARFSFNEEGITMYVGFRAHEFKWSEFSCAGIVAVNPGVKSRTPSDTFWVYFAKTNLTEKERIRFLSKTRRDLNRIAYFQYSEPIINQIMEIVPEKLRRDLTWDRETVVGEMRFWEKVYNK